MVAEEIALHAAHERGEGPEGHGVVLKDGIEGREEVGHALHVAEGRVVLVVGQEHVFHLLEVDVGAGVSEGGVGIWVRGVFACEEGDEAVCSVDIFFYSEDPKRWELSA